MNYFVIGALGIGVGAAALILVTLTFVLLTLYADWRDRSSKDPFGFTPIRAWQILATIFTITGFVYGIYYGTTL